MTFFPAPLFFPFPSFVDEEAHSALLSPFWVAEDGLGNDSLLFSFFLRPMEEMENELPFPFSSPHYRGQMSEFLRPFLFSPSRRAVALFFSLRESDYGFSFFPAYFSFPLTDKENIVSPPFSQGVAQESFFVLFFSLS